MDNAIIDLIKKLATNTKEQALNMVKTYCNENCDQTRIMKIEKKIDDSHYYVRYNNKSYKAFSRYNHKIGETVYVTICCGNLRKMIIH